MGRFTGTSGNDTFQAYMEAIGSTLPFNPIFSFYLWQSWTIKGGDGDDALTGGEVQDTIYGGNGNDFINGLEGDDELYGDDGQDFILGGLGNDNIGGGNGDDFVFGDDGNDKLFGQFGNDTLVGGAGNDSLYGGVLDNVDADSMSGGTGNDAYYINSFGDDVIEYAGEGIDTIYSYVGIYALGNEVENLTLRENAGVGYGNALNNTIIGSSAANRLEGKDGNDTLDGGAGVDILLGDNGNDSLVGGSENDSLYGSFDKDTLLGGDGNDKLFGGSGSDILDGGNGNDTLYGGGYPVHSDEHDILTGGSGADRFVLGGAYLGYGHAVITDFAYGQGDKLQLYADAAKYNEYTESDGNFYAGTAALDTAIFHNGDVIAILQDVSGSGFILNLDSVFV